MEGMISAATPLMAQTQVIARLVADAAKEYGRPAAEIATDIKDKLASANPKTRIDFTKIPEYGVFQDKLSGGSDPNAAVMITELLSAVALSKTFERVMFAAQVKQNWAKTRHVP